MTLQHFQKHQYFYNFDLVPTGPILMYGDGSGKRLEVFLKVVTSSIRVP